jgi:hypothetical protein
VMAEVPEAPGVPGPGEAQPGVRSAVAWSVALLAGGALLGLLCGLIWNEVAPRALLQEIGAGTAEVLDAETRAFFGADVWFCGIASVAGLLAGLAGYRFAVAPRAGYARAAVAAALLVGGVLGELTMLWLGGQIGLSGYNHLLASSPTGTMFSSSLALGSKSALACWPLFTGIVLLIAEWGTRRGDEETPAEATEPGGAGPWMAGPGEAGPGGAGPGQARA